jgi:hypothetical protein
MSYVITIDVEWAHPVVLKDLVDLLDQRKLKATFFCTHPGIEVPGHERALHPNFRRNGEVYREVVADPENSSDEAIYRGIVERTLSFAPEALGVRPHSLFYCSELVPIYRAAGLAYHSSVVLPLQAGLSAYRRERGLWEFPLFYMDHLDLMEGWTGFELGALGLERPGLKVFDFHPNMVYLNAGCESDYEKARSIYHQPEALLGRRRRGAGVRSLFLELLDFLAERPEQVHPLRDLLSNL